MKHLRIKSTVLFFLTFCLKSIAQPGVDWQLIGNAIIGGQFLGTTNAQPFNMQTVLNQPIRVRTNYGLAVPGLGNRTIFTGGAFGNNDGQIAFGNDLPDNFNPTARLHLHQTGGFVFTRYTTDNIGSTNTDGFMTGINNNGQSFLVNFEDDQPMSFMTENLPNPSPFERMRVNANNLNGFIGMGNAGNFTANSQLHINTLGIAGGGLGAAAYGNLFRTDGFQTNRNQWQMFTGLNNAGLTEKGVLFTDLGVATQVGQPTFNQFNIQASMADIILRAMGYSLSALTPAPTEVVRITRTAYTDPTGTNDEGRMSISRRGALAPITYPFAMLHIGDRFMGAPPYANPNGVAGWRPWMNVGTYNQFGSDNMYLGIRIINVDRSEAIINWGNNPSPQGIGDRMRFIFTAAPNNGNASGPDGLEISHMWSDGNEGRTGFGGGLPFNNAYTAPGDDPGNTVEINSFDNVGPTSQNGCGGTGFSGLRFTDLNAMSTPCQVNPGPGVLTVDLNGDVIYVPDAPTTGPFFFMRSNYPRSSFALRLLVAAE